MTTFFFVLMILGWLAGVSVLFGWAISLQIDGRNRAAIVVGILAMVVFAGSIAIADEVMSRDDPNKDRLCLHGHEEWRDRYRPAMLVGKVVVPGGRYLDKVLVCDEWEPR